MIICCFIRPVEIITIFIALAACIIAYFQLRSLKKNREADFIHRFKNDFFSLKTRQIIFFIEMDLIKFVQPKLDSEYPYFEINKIELEKLSNSAHEFVEVATKFNYKINALDLDDYLLGHFIDIGLFVNKKMMNIDLVYETFGWYIDLTSKNKAISSYVNWQDNQKGYENIYYWYKSIINKCLEYQNRKK